jgi:hypothetical protein
MTFKIFPILEPDDVTKIWGCGVAGVAEFALKKTCEATHKGMILIAFKASFKD